MPFRTGGLNRVSLCLCIFTILIGGRAESQASGLTCAITLNRCLNADAAPYKPHIPAYEWNAIYDRLKMSETAIASRVIRNYRFD